MRYEFGGPEILGVKFDLGKMWFALTSSLFFVFLEWFESVKAS